MPTPNSASPRKYHDFELTIAVAAAPHTYRVTARATSGQANGQSTLDPGSDEWRTALDALQRQDTDEALLMELGARLFRALFPDDVEDAYRASWGYAHGEDKRLRLRLHLTQAPEIAALPWEYLYDRQRDLFIGVSVDSPLSRFIEPQQIFPSPPPPEGKLRLLTVVSDPVDLGDYGLRPLDAEAELETLDKALTRLRTKGLLEEIAPLRHAVYSDISEALRAHRPHVLHFIGHGMFEEGRGKLILEHTDHYAMKMTDRAFRELLEGHPNTRLVVLNACQGAARAATDAMVGMGPQLVSRSVPAVVAMQYLVQDLATIAFTREFYRALSHWYPIDVAVSQARRAVYLGFGSGQRDWGAPVLFMRDESGLLFAPPSSAAPADAVATSADAVATSADAVATSADAVATSAETAPARSDAPPPELSIDPADVSPINLRQAMISRYDTRTFQFLCNDLAFKYREQGVPLSYGVEYHNLAGEALASKILELIQWHQRQNRLADLVRRVLQDFPDLSDELVY